MPRQLRINPIDMPVHVIQRGNNRQVCFNGDDGLSVYTHWFIWY